MSIKIEPRSNRNSSGEGDASPAVKGLLRRSAQSERPDRADRPSRAAAGTVSTTPGPPPLPSRRSPKWIALGVVAVCLGGLLSYFLYTEVASETTAVVSTRVVRRGEVIELADLAVVQVRGTSRLPIVPGQQLEELVGKHAVLDLAAGALVAPDAVGDVLIPGEGHTVVGLRLAEGRTVVGEIPVGTPLRLVALPATTGTDEEKDPYAGKVYTARLVDQRPGADGISTLLNIDLPQSQAAAVGTLAALDRLVVLREAEG